MKVSLKAMGQIVKDKSKREYKNCFSDKIAKFRFGGRWRWEYEDESTNGVL